ncbi:metallophosphoesterase family protein, partial [Klebsiella pneumoniae]|uniref:metallophosphoesterase family protein n=1 Tax=Klebsiella pneumoniae TaxID=573 RepID=UPI0013D18B6F
TTDDPAERRRRMAEFKQIVGELKVKTVRFMPGAHDASLDRGAAFKELFGDTYYRFDHKGVHFIALDNVSDRGTTLGAEQLAWMQA